MTDVPPGCSVDGCERRVLARGWCQLHYERWYRRGSPHHVPFSVYPTIDDQFARSVRPTFLGCWWWVGSIGNHGYGRLRKREGDQKTEILAHRYSYEKFVGPIPAGLSIDHICRNRPCVNPLHLDPVTLAENTHRQWLAVGEALVAARRAAKTHCIRGHEFTPENTYCPPGFPNKRACRACKASRQRQRRWSLSA